jgi:hypothetical protein
VQSCGVRTNPEGAEWWNSPLYEQLQRNRIYSVLFQIFFRERERESTRERAREREGEREIGR